MGLAETVDRQIHADFADLAGYQSIYSQ